MPRPHSIVKTLYRALVPASVRASHAAGRLKAHLLGHDWIYDAEFYQESVEGPARRSAARIADTIVDELKATRIIDVGCGTGALLEALRDRGCRVYGLEYAEAALRYCRARRLEVAKFDLERDVYVDTGTFDVAISMEVAEHLPASTADRYVDLLTRLSAIVVFTAAPPGQGGTDHVNEQPPSYWTDKFQARGFEHAVAQSQRWRDSWTRAHDVERWYHENLMIFRRVRAR
ncbi:MAG: class I SAM-dependent methyltransferase [Vicinamibacterales bacterium]